MNNFLYFQNSLDQNQFHILHNILIQWKEEVNEISRAYVTEYWFDDVEQDVIDLLKNDEWETVPLGINETV